MRFIITSTGDELFSGFYTDDFEWPWTSKIGDFSVPFAVFRLQRTFQNENAPKLQEIDLDNLRVKIFGIERSF